MTLKPLSPLKYITRLNVSQNNITKLLDMKEIPDTLEDIDFSYNQIKLIPDLSQHKYLRNVNLDNNLIQKIEGFSKNINLKNLSLANNQIEVIENLDNLNLVSLNLKGNKIKQLSGLDQLNSLRTLNL